MVENAYFLAKIGADTAENEQHFAEILPKLDLAHCPGERLDHHAEDNMNVLLEGVRGCWLSPIGLVSRHGSWAKFVLSLNTQPAEILQIFGGLVLGCIKTKLCKKICV